MRRTFFSFHYAADVWRAWNVRNSWMVTPTDQDDRGFFDSSVFEESKRTSVEGLKRFLTDGLNGTSVTCVLAGTQTWLRRWVRYEIARSLARGNGLLTVDVHGIADRHGQTVVKGPNPLDNMGVYKTAQGIFIAEWKDGKWVKYADYTLAIAPGELWFPAPTTTAVAQLSKYCLRRDFVANEGRQHIGEWIESAAAAAGR